MRSATILLVAFSLVMAGCFRLSGPGPVVTVKASYPDANAEVVRDTIAAPIEQQVNGVERMVRLESESKGDGSYAAYVRFQAGIDPSLALVLVENRVSLATPMLPDAVKKAGIKVADGGVTAGGQKRVAIALIDRGSRGRDALRQFSAAVLKRLAAEGAITNPETFPGPDKDEVDVDIDRAKWAKFGIPLSEVFEMIHATRGSADVEAAKKLRVKSAKGEKIPLDKVATVKLMPRPTAVYRVNMYPAVRISGSPPQGETAESAASRCAELADKERQNRNDADEFSVLDLTEQ